MKVSNNNYSNNDDEMNTDEMIINDNKFGGNISINSILQCNNPVLKPYNLNNKPDKLNGNISDLFKNLSIPTCLFNMRGGNNNDINDTNDFIDSDSDEDIDKEEDIVEKEEPHHGGKRKHKKQSIHHNPEAGIVSNDLYSKFLKIVQDFDEKKSHNTNNKKKKYTRKQQKQSVNNASRKKKKD
jgi:hypothetical protein